MKRALLALALLLTPHAAMAGERAIWVAPEGSDDGSGTRGDPFATIQHAVKQAEPGATVMVRAGEYRENVKLPKAGGAPGAPIELISADGPQEAIIIAATDETSTIKGLGTDHFIIRDFLIEGGKNGIQFSQSGKDFSDTVEDVLIEGNVVRGAKEDGIKISQADKVRIRDNWISDVGQEGIDFVNVFDSEIRRNSVSGVRGPAGIFAKGGSRDVVIAGNKVHDVKNDGITIGGWTSPGFARPGTTTFEARAVRVLDNKVTKVGKRPLNILGAQKCEARGNYFEANPKYFTAIGVGTGNPKVDKPARSRDIEIVGNVIARKKAKLIAIEKGNDNNIVFKDNKIDAAWKKPVGPQRRRGDG